jgi:type-F conjugative transfer system secretin TraK
MRKWPLIVSCLLLYGQAFGLQIKSVVDNETTTAKISSLDVTRIFVQGDRIKSIRGVKGAYTRENDESNGEVYLQPSPLYQERAFTILVDTEQGRHFTLLLNPVAVPSDTLMLVPKGVGRVQAAHFEQSSPYEMTISRLMRAMVNAEVPEGYAITEVNNPKLYLLGNIATLQLKTIYQGLNLRGEIYEIKNKCAFPITLDERQFYKIGTRAISLEAITLAPHAKVNLYRVLSHA